MSNTILKILHLAQLQGALLSGAVVTQITQLIDLSPEVKAELAKFETARNAAFAACLKEMEKVHFTEGIPENEIFLADAAEATEAQLNKLTFGKFE